VTYHRYGLVADFVQDNMSRSCSGTLARAALSDYHSQQGKLGMSLTAEGFSMSPSTCAVAHPRLEVVRRDAE